MIERRSFKSYQIAFWFSMVFLSLMCILFLIEKSSVLFEYRLYVLTTSGVFGILSIFSFGWYASKKGRPQESLFKHNLFALGLTVTTLLVYFTTYTIAMLIF